MNGRTFVLTLAMAALTPLAASAQPPSSGPMTIERLHSGFMGGPEVKLSTVDGHTSELVGGSVGWLTDDTLFIGGAGYWLANGSHDREMAYGGLVVQWLGRSRERIGYGVKGLIGGGQATLTESFTQFVVPRDLDVDLRGLGLGSSNDLNQIIRNAASRTANLRVHDGFFVAEPEANIFVRLTEHLRLVGGAGYRFVGADRNSGNRLRGATGTLSLQVS